MFSIHLSIQIFNATRQQSHIEAVPYMFSWRNKKYIYLIPCHIQAMNFLKLGTLAPTKKFWMQCDGTYCILILFLQIYMYLFLSLSQWVRFLSRSSGCPLSKFLFLSSGYQLLLELSPWNHFLLELSSFFVFFSEFVFEDSLSLLLEVPVSSFLGLSGSTVTVLEFLTLHSTLLAKISLFMHMHMPFCQTLWNTRF